MMENNFGQGIADTSGAGATIVAPTLGQTILTMAGLVVGGVYRVRITVALTGTAETGLVNVQFRNNAVFHHSIPALTDKVVTVELPRVTATGTGFSLTAAAAGVAGSIYNTHATITRIE